MNSGLFRKLLEIGLIPFKRLCLLSNSNDFNRFNGVTSNNTIDNILPLDDMAENSMLPIQPGCRIMSDKKLAPVSIRPCVGHGQNALAIMGQSAIDFVAKLITWPASAIALWITTLNHEIGNHTMKG